MHHFRYDTLISVFTFLSRKQSLKTFIHADLPQTLYFQDRTSNMQTDQGPEVPDISARRAAGTAPRAPTVPPPFLGSASCSELAQTHHF